MTDSKPFEFKTSVPRVFVADVAAAVIFYTEKLGFDLWFEEQGTAAALPASE
jgi:catechol 2,3-dioxygenase-like lactoylglutathione lyase family enzyme